MLGLIAGAIGFLAFAPYIKSILAKKTTPNRATWLIWAVLGIIIAASYYSAGARESAWVPIAYAVGLVFVAGLSLRYGEGGWTPLDLFCLAGAAIGLLLWALTSEPLFALYLTIAVDALGGVPTLKKAHERPESEDRLTWLMFLAANTLNLFAIGEWTVAIASYPVYVFILSLAMSALLARQGKDKRVKR
ncbi:MAG: hypothetical protein AB1529_03860 [Candidatus Micrarchaeota archaeon]